MESHTNYMGAPSYCLSSALTTLEVVAASCFFGEPLYYGPSRKASGGGFQTDLKESRNTVRKSLGNPVFVPTKGSDEELVRIIREALTEDPEGTLQLAVRLRHIHHIRKTPQIILVEAARHPAVRGTHLIRTYAPHIIARADEPGVQKEYLDAAYKKGRYPNSLKRAWASAVTRMSDYEIAKYKNSGHLIDIVNVCHPKPTDGINRLMQGKIALTEEDTWEALISKKGASKETWMEAIPIMGHMALLRNLRNFLNHSVPPEAFLPKLIATAAGGKQLPFRYYSAYQAISGLDNANVSVVKEALSECLKESLGLVPRFSGNVMSLCDNSGSAQSATTSSLGTVRVNEIANLSALITALASDNGQVGVFGDTLNVVTPDATDPFFENLNKINRLGGSVGASTENGIWLFWDRAISKREHWDHVFVYSDMQAGHGGLYGKNPANYRNYMWRDTQYIDVPKLIKVYRETVNPSVNVYLVQVAGYSDTIIPDVYPRTFILGGWGEGILKYADQMARIFDGIEGKNAGAHSS